MEPKHPQDSNIEPVTAPVDTTPFVTDTATPVTSHSPLGAETPATPSQPPLWRRILIRTLQVIFLAYIALVLFRIPHVIEKEKTAAVVAQIHATKLTMDDVMGTNLPPDPGALADATIAGVDANTNGIRDDVELAIFRDYATSSKTRAVLLQYALIKQMQATLPIVNEVTVTTSVEDTESRAHVCLWSLFADSRSELDAFLKEVGDDPAFEVERKERWREHFQKVDDMEAYIDSLIKNTPERESYYKNFYRLVRSYSASNEGCDIDPKVIQ